MENNTKINLLKKYLHLKTVTTSKQFNKINKSICNYEMFPN